MLVNKYTIAALIIVLVVLAYFMIFKRTTKDTVGALTDNWIKAVTVNHDPKEIAGLFCKDGNLVGTVSQTIRRGAAIESYFDYFAKLPNIKVVKKEYQIEKVTRDVFLNTAFITWKWDGLYEPIVARMSFLFRGDCIFQLHSSALPEMNKDLKKLS